ncbi:MAG TPA: glycoside hydrolase family 6 protein [Jatrophihabitans sp.]|jgi:endoglucanase
MRPSRTEFPRSCLILVLAALAVLAVVVPSGTAPVAHAQITAHAQQTRTVQSRSTQARTTASAANPLANLRWGTYSGSHDELFNAYRHSSGTTHRLVGTLAFKPRMRWFGAWYSNKWISTAVHRYIRNVTHGRSDVLVQMAVFRVVPWETRACDRLPTTAEQNSYKQWINRFASAIGRTHVALVLQPDLPFAFCVPHHSRIPLNLVSYAARVFSALAHTSVYIDAGAADWSPVDRAVTLLKGAGIRYARGFALDATHYDSTTAEIYHGTKIVRALRAAGYPTRRFVINTATTGRPFTHPWYVHHVGSNFNNARTCANRSERHCVTVGIPPTWHVAAPGLPMSARVKSLAHKFVDGYMWIGRPWLRNQASPFDMQRALAVARTNPFR